MPGARLEEDTMIIEGALAHAPVTTSRTRTRQTPTRGAAVRFDEILRAGGEVLVAGAEAALSTLPGGPVLCAAVRGSAEAAARAGRGPSASGADPTSPGSSVSDVGSEEQDIWDMTRESQAFNLMYLQLQEEMSRENRRYTALSNVLKTRHETCRAIIGNV
jgi:hypothetical protein